MPLGLPTGAGESFEERLKEVSIQMSDGDLFFLFTDGVTEATDREGGQYGMDRLTTLLEAQLTTGDIGSVSALADTVVSEIDDFSGYVQANDDITFLIARCRLIEDQAEPSTRGQKSADDVEVTKIPKTPVDPSDNQ